MGALGGVWEWLAGASVPEWTIRLVYAAAVPQTLFVLGFGLRNTWWTSLLGWGQFTKALAVELLLLMSIDRNLTGWAPGPWIAFWLVLLILLGATLQCAAWAAEKRHQRRGGQPRANNPDLYA